MDEKQIDGLAARIRTARKAARMTQAHLAEACGLERTSVTNLEAGRQMPRLDMLYRMAAALKLEPHELLGIGPAARPCCGDWSRCTRPCAPRADHWRSTANALQAEVNDLNRFVARMAMRGRPAEREGCDYVAEAGACCRKCRQVHAG